MLQIQNDVNLSAFNTFKVSVSAKNFAVIHNTEELSNLPIKQPFMVLGEGANVLFTRDFDGLVIKNEILGREVIVDDENDTVVRVGSGENWHEFVLWSVKNGLSGIENLAYIPGTVGAAPVQNIAAYGQTVGEVIESVQGYHLSDLGNLSSLSQSDCHFFYRDSIFKHALKDKFIVTSVTFDLSQVSHFDINYHSRYESLKGELTALFPNQSTPYSPSQVAQSVVSIRSKKLPDWHKIGTAGSFFKNPFVSKEKFAKLQEKMPDLQPYPVDHMLYPNSDDPVFQMSEMVKIPAGRLLDELGWKGKKIGNVGAFEKHALVVVNYGEATGQEILEFTQLMAEDVRNNFGIELECEVNII